MPIRSLTDFEQILLGIIVGAPSSGYSLKKQLGDSPAGVYQPSSGALYPALRRLERDGMLRSVSDVSAGSRTRCIYYVTPAGLAAHAEWVQLPVNPATVGRDLGLHLMRFVFMENLLPPDQVIAFLASLGDALGGFIAKMEAYPASGLPHQVLAIEHGIAVYSASYAWTRRAQRVLAGQQEPTGKSVRAEPERRVQRR